MHLLNDIERFWHVLLEGGFAPVLPCPNTGTLMTTAAFATGLPRPQ
jgi:hypothetical protein